MILPPPSPLPANKITQKWCDQKPLLSVVCVCYNHASFIESTLSGIFSQETNFPFEVIIYDDASSDGSVEIINRWQREYPNIINTILQEENQFSRGITPGAIALKVCRGNYIAFCQGDDYWTDPQKLQTQADYLEANPECALTYHASISFQDGKVIGSGKYACDISAKMLKKTLPIATLTACFRNIPELKNFPRELQGSPVADACFWSLLGHHGYAHYMPSISPAAYRVHNGGIFSLVGQAKRDMMAITTYINLSNYYQEKHIDLHLYFLNKAARLIKKVNRTTPWYNKILKP